MNLRAMIPLVLALLLGVVAFVVGRNVLSRRLAGPADTRPNGKVLVASKDLPIGHELRAADVALVDMPKDLIPRSSFTKPEDAAGRLLSAPILKGQVVVEPLLSSKGAMSALQAAVPKGMRAITVEVNEVSGLAGLIAPGCNVDLVATLVDEKTRQTVAGTIVQNVKVSAVGQEITPHTQEAAGGSAEPGKEKEQDAPKLSRSVTLIATPEQAAAIDLTATKAPLRLVLRNSADNQVVDTSFVTLGELMGEQVDPNLNQRLAGEELREEIRKQVALSLQAAQPTTRPVPPNAGAGPVKPVVVAAAPPQRLFVQVIRGGVASTHEFGTAGSASNAQPARAARTNQGTKRERTTDKSN